MDEVIAQVRSTGGEQLFTYSFLGNEVVFDHEVTLAELCKKMLTFDNIKSCVKEMKPWGENETLVIPYSWAELGGNQENDFIVLIYRETE